MTFDSTFQFFDLLYQYLNFYMKGGKDDKKANPLD